VGGHGADLIEMVAADNHSAQRTPPR
jgi:hypothetical protein